MDSFQTSNFLQTNNFMLVIPSFEATRFLSTRFVIPNINLPSARADTPFSTLKFAGDKVEFSPLEFEFIIDETMTNYTEVYQWLVDISYTESFDAFKSYQKKSNYQPLGEQDIKVIILDSKNNPIKTFTFYNAIPIGLSTGEMQSTVSEVDYMRASVIFDYDYYVIED
ncbi:MAG TPA: hypothetical protein VFM18_19635 [Methanosarcina sp.]|nr:hypothetical protein [Methanosarcina sp.]